MAKKPNLFALATSQLKSANTTFLTTEEQKAQLIELDELRSWIPSPTEEEVKQLETNLVVNGCRDALIVWETTHGVIYPDTQTPDQPAYVLVDGHNRHRICKKKGIDFRIQLMSFSDLKAVKDFMIDLQLGRRNLTPQQIQYFRGLRYLNERGRQGGDRNQPPEGPPPVNTAQKLAHEYRVGEATIKRDAEFAEGLQQMTPPLQQAVLTGKVKVSKKQVQQLAKTKPATPIERLEDLETLVVSPASLPETAIPEAPVSQQGEELKGIPDRPLTQNELTNIDTALLHSFRQQLEHLLKQLDEEKPLSKESLNKLSLVIDRLKGE